ncbi:MAG: hypothetical protein RQ885_10555 [Desulfurococcales archaeon]|nr:hypothetical protein [Desulfurococcales archaeon]
MLLILAIALLIPSTKSPEFSAPRLSGGRVPHPVDGAVIGKDVALI